MDPTARARRFKMRRLSHIKIRVTAQLLCNLIVEKTQGLRGMVAIMDTHRYCSGAKEVCGPMLVVVLPRYTYAL